MTPVLSIVTLPVGPLTLMPIPATFESTPVLSIVTSPVAVLTLIPAPAIFESTPVLLTVNDPSGTAPEATRLIPKPAPRILLLARPATDGPNVRNGSLFEANPNATAGNCGCQLLSATSHMGTCPLSVPGAIHPLGPAGYGGWRER